MKRSNYLLKIEAPCPESWEAMSPTTSGRFCASCAKNVTDFTKLSDDQMLEIIRKSNGNLCGRLEESQMNRFLVNKTEPSNKARFFQFVAGLFLLSATESQAQEMIKREPMAMVQPPTEQEKFEKEIRDNPEYALKTLVSGQIIADSTNQPVEGAWIRVKGLKHVVYSDEGGFFQLHIPDSLANKQNEYSVIQPYIGRKNFVAGIDDFPDVISIGYGPRRVISVGGLTVVKRKWWQRRKKYCK